MRKKWLIYSIFFINLLLGNSVTIFIIRNNLFTHLALVELISFNLICTIFFIFLLRFYNNYEGAYARFFMTLLWIIATIFFSQGIVAMVANASYSLTDIIQAFIFGGSLAVIFTCIFWIPVAIFNFFILNFIYKKRKLT